LWLQEVKLFRPRRHDLLGNSRQGKQFGAKIFDPTPAASLRTFATGYTGNMIERDGPRPFWIQFEAPFQWLMDDDDVKEYFQACQEQIAYGFSHSTYYKEHLPFMMDAAAPGNAVMLAEEDEAQDQMIFQTIHPRDNFFAVDRYGKTNVYQRPLTLEAVTALEMFGKDNLPDDLVKNAEGKNPFHEYEFIHALYKNVQADGRYSGTLSKAWIQFYVWRRKGGTTANNRRLVEMKGVEHGPIILKLGTDSGCTYATGPAADALTSALYGNKLGEKQLRAAHFAVEGRWLGHGSLKHKFQRKPGGVTWTDDIQTKRIESLLDRQSNWPVSDAQMDKIDDAIREVFNVPFFEMVSRTREGPQMTAYQVSQIVNEKLPQMTPVLEAMEDDDLEPATDIIWDSETRKGRMPDAPQILVDMAQGQKIVNRYMGRLAVLRRTIDQTQNTLTQIEMIRMLIDIWPSVAMRIKSANFMERALLSAGMNQKDIVEDAEFEEIQAIAAEQQAEERQLEIAERMGKLLPGMTKGAEKGSMAEALVA
jgi:hypothetical protein